MQKLIILIAAFSISAGNIARAGDPCPIEVNISDLGSPEWLDNLALINALKSKQTWLGLSFSTTPEGLHLTRVFEGSPAKSAGLMVGDEIVAIGGVSALEDAIFERLNIGETVEIDLLRGGKALRLPLIVGGQDPVPLAMVHHLQTVDCRAPNLAPPSPEMRQAVMARLFTKNRRFRCDDAHVALEPLMEQYQSDTVFFVRGSRRLLITMPYYGTTCVAATSLDGENLTGAALDATIERVIGAYVQHRHDFP